MKSWFLVDANIAAPWMILPGTA